MPHSPDWRWIYTLFIYESAQGKTGLPASFGVKIKTQEAAYFSCLDLEFLSQLYDMGLIFWTYTRAQINSHVFLLSEHIHHQHIRTCWMKTLVCILKLNYHEMLINEFPSRLRERGGVLQSELCFCACFISESSQVQASLQHSQDAFIWS